MNIYEIDIIENAIERIAKENDGEIPEFYLKQLVEAQAQSIAQIENLVKYIRHAEQFIDACKDEEKRISDRRRTTENRIESIKKYLTPFVDDRGKFDAGTFTLSTRKSSSVELEDNFNDPDYCIQIISYKPDKKKIKLDIESGKEIPGAKLIEKKNLQIK